MQKNSKKFQNNKKIFILGASSDIGLEVVKKFLSQGYEVIGHYNKNKRKLSKIKNKKLFLFRFDLKNIEKFEESVKKNKRLKSVTNFLSLTGYQNPSSIFKFQIQDFYTHINVNYLSNIIFLRAVIKPMIRNNYGRILLTSSIGTKYGGGINTFAYSISKFMNEFFPKYLREINYKNIIVNTLQIGLTNTKLIHKDKSKNLKKRIELIPIKRMATINEVSGYIFDFFKEENKLITNQIINISGGE